MLPRVENVLNLNAVSKVSAFDKLVVNLFKSLNIFQGGRVEGGRTGFAAAKARQPTVAIFISIQIK